MAITKNQALRTKVKISSWILIEAFIDNYLAEHFNGHNTVTLFQTTLDSGLMNLTGRMLITNDVVFFEEIPVKYRAAGWTVTKSHSKLFFS